MTAHYFLGSRLIATASIPLPPSGIPACSCAFFCSTCGDVWGRVLVEEAVGGWQLFNIPCEKHAPTGVPDWGKIPGSFLQLPRSADEVSVMLTPLTITYAPLSILRRELLLALSTYDERTAQ